MKTIILILLFALANGILVAEIAWVYTKVQHWSVMVIPRMALSFLDVLLIIGWINR